MSRKTLTERVAELEEQVRALQLAKIVDPPYYPSYPVPPVWPAWPQWPYLPTITSDQTNSLPFKVVAGSYPPIPA